MNNHIANFKEFLRTPFPYMFLALCLFLSSTMLTNASFYSALTQTDSAYSLCLVCSDPAAKDVLSDLGFTVANFVLFPVSAAAFLLNGLPNIFGIYIFLSALYGISMPFVIFSVYGALDERISRTRTHRSVYQR